MDKVYELANNLFMYVANMDIIQMPIIGMKTLAVLFLIITWTSKIGEGYISTGNPLKRNSEGGLDMNEIIKGILLLVLLGSYDYIIDEIETILSSFSSDMEDQLLKLQGSSDYLDALENSMKSDATSWVEYILSPGKAINDLMSYLSPFSGTGLFIQVAFLIDIFAFFFFLGKRGFQILVWKLFFPIILLLFFVDRSRKLITEYFKEGIRVYLVIIPFLLANFFCSASFRFILTVLSSSDNKSSPLNAPLSSSRAGIILLFIVILKVTLFKLSENKIMPNLIK